MEIPLEFLNNTQILQIHYFHQSIKLCLWQVRVNLVSEYGEVRSFLADEFPECRRTKFVKMKAEEDS